MRLLEKKEKKQNNKTRVLDRIEGCAVEDLLG